jgi:hypothetical protein
MLMLQLGLAPLGQKLLLLPLTLRLQEDQQQHLRLNLSGLVSVRAPVNHSQELQLCDPE